MQIETTTVHSNGDHGELWIIGDVRIGVWRGGAILISGPGLSVPIYQAKDRMTARKVAERLAVRVAAA